jgi:hypothetical protein
MCVDFFAQAVWNDVYSYWKHKRQKINKPLLRRYWPVTSANDTDPHKVFRPREKERYKVYTPLYTSTYTIYVVHCI